MWRIQHVVEAVVVRYKFLEYFMLAPTRRCRTFLSACSAVCAAYSAHAKYSHCLDLGFGTPTKVRDATGRFACMRVYLFPILTSLAIRHHKKSQSYLSLSLVTKLEC